MKRHLKSNQHSLKEKEVTTFIQDLLETPPQAKSALETSNYKADPSHIKQLFIPTDNANEQRNVPVGSALLGNTPTAT